MMVEESSTPSDTMRLRPAAFLDRDGVINVDHGYVFRSADLTFTPTAVRGIRLLNDKGYLVIVVTNQSGIARGLYTSEDVERFHTDMQSLLAAQGARIDAFYYSPYHPEGSTSPYDCDHEDRKPNPGMVLRALREWPIRREGSFMIGDKQSDMEAAERAGMRGLLVPSNTCDLAEAATTMIDWSRGTAVSAVHHA